MNTFGSKPSTWGLMTLWHRFHIWRALRKLDRVIALRTEAEILMADATMLFRKHSIPPAGPLFDRLEGGR